MTQLDLENAFRQALDHHRGNRLAEAEGLCRKILEVEPRHFDSLHLLGVVQAQAGRPADALRHMDAAVKINPRIPPMLNNRGNILKDLGRLAEALVSYEAAIVIAPDYADAHVNRGHALLVLGRLDEALGAYDRAITLRPQDVEAHLGRAGCLMDLRRPSEALSSYDRAATLAPGDPQVHEIRARALFAAKQFENALASCDRALALAPTFAEVYFVRGNALIELKRMEEAFKSFERAIALKPDCAEAYNNRGHALRALGRLKEALASYDRAIALRPDYAGALMSRGMLNLLFGRFAEGWADYEWRLRHTDEPTKRPTIGAPEWRGEALAGRRLIVLSEQGFGDIIQFSRYLPLVRARAGDVVFVVAEKLARLLRSVTQGLQVLHQPPALRPTDLQSALLSLPLRFGIDGATIPAALPYLQPEPELVAHWKGRLGDDGLKIGIAWQASPGAETAGERSVPLAQFAPLARLPGVRLISLQKHLGLDQMAMLPKDVRIEMPGEDFDEGPDAFIDTAAVMANLDLIVTADTVIAHLAGALARPTWVALPHVPDWRWLLDRDDSPWYPTVRLFRQKRANDWDGVFAEIATVLRARSEQREAWMHQDG